MATGGVTNQENISVRPKNVDTTNGANASNASTVSTAAAPRPVLRDVRNRQPAQPAPKRTTSLKATKADDATAAAPKIGARPVLRSTSSASNVLIPAKAVQPKPFRVANKTTTSATNKSTASTIGGNGTLNSMVAANGNTSKSSGSFVLNNITGKPRLPRSNAVSSLHAAAAGGASHAGSSTARSETTEAATFQAAAGLAPLQEESENCLSPQRDNAYSSAMMPPNNIDAGDGENPQMVSDYVNDIYDYLRFLEKKQPIRENFLDGKEVTGRMRGILVDWLCQVHVRFHLLPETLYMTVALIDRFLQAFEAKVPKEKFQLVGVTAMFVASKYEEMYAPEIVDFCYITDNSVTTQDIRAMEILMLRTLKFSLGRPLSIHFLRRYSKAAEADATRHTLAKYFLELSLVHYQLAHYPPSVMAAAAIWLASKLLDPRFEWSAAMEYYTKYREAEFMPCLRRLCRVVVGTHTNEIKQQTVRNKFGTSKFMDISKHPCLNMTLIRQFGGL